MSAFEVGQTVYWVNGQGQEQAGRVVGTEDGWITIIDPSVGRGTTEETLRAETVHGTLLEAWEAFRALEVLPHLAYVDGLRQHWKQLDDWSWVRLQHLRAGAAARIAYETDGSFQGGTDGDWEAR